MSLELQEQHKYERMWSMPQYRRNSPAEGLVERAIELLDIEPNSTIADLGCGTGRASKKFCDLGMNVVAFDHAENCLDSDIDVQFEQACLWELDTKLEFDYGFCVDVMEHIPTEKVAEVLDNISCISQKGAFFQIATRPDTCGRLIGETLHMTVRDGRFWVAEIEKAFNQLPNYKISGKGVIAWLEKA